MGKLNEAYTNLVLKAAEKNWVNNQKKMLAKGVNKESYILGYLHGYSACFDVYDIGEDEHPPKK